MKFLVFLAAIAITTATASAANMVFLQCPTIIPTGLTDSFEVAVYIQNDVAFNGFTMGYFSRSTEIKFLSASPAEGLLALERLGRFDSRTFGGGYEIGIGWRNATTSYMFPIHTTPVHTYNIWLQASSSYNGECVNIDSGYIPVNRWQWFIDHPPTWLIPGFTDCGSCDLLGPVFTCGDADASGQIDVTDAVYLVNYIFAEGPSPQDPAAGDFDCNGQTDITDAVYMINYIFAEGPAPCSACP